MKRRSAIAALAASLAGLTAACSKIGQSAPGQKLFGMAQDWHRRAHRALAARQALAPEYDRADISPDFRGNGSISVDSPAYRASLAKGFADWRLAVRGLVERPLELSLDDLRALPQRRQITRHDCVEGWSAIGEWTGVPLSFLLDLAQIRPEARFIVFRCADLYDGVPYYESVDLVDAYHPQTIVAHQLNGAPIPEKNGAPLRMRVERQLGYKHAKFLTAIEAVSSLERIGKGKGGYWEDRTGYQWYAGL